MKRHLIVRPAAEQDITEAFDWYSDHAPEHAERFLNEFRALTVRIRESPEMFRIVHEQVRRAGLRVFPYLVWFVLDENSGTVQILAVTHQRRDPVAVRSRLHD